MLMHLMKNSTLRPASGLCLVARHLSFIRAAEELNLTAPACRCRSRNSRQKSDCPCFDQRVVRSRSLWSGNYVFGAHEHAACRQCGDAEDLVARFRVLADRAPLDVGMGSTAEYFLPRLLAPISPGSKARLENSHAVANTASKSITLMAAGRY